MFAIYSLCTIIIQQFTYVFSNITMNISSLPQQVLTLTYFKNDHTML